MSAMPMSNTGLGLVGIDDETQARMRRAIGVAGIRRRGAVTGGSVSGISRGESEASEIRLLNAQRTRQMQDYFTYQPVGQIERAAFEGLTHATGGLAMSKMAGVVPNFLSRVAPNRLASGVGAVNRRIGAASETFHYPGRMFNKQAATNYAMKSAGSPTGMAMGGFDDLPFLGGVLDINRLRYTVTNPGVYLSKLMAGEARELTGRKRKPPPEITGPMTEEEARMYTDYGQ
tara:strand:+ start:1084 stop:1776 length:693 start_codon:yes stop_codon:yes gene_type:complete